MQQGIERIRDISISLRTFSRDDNDRLVSFNIHDGINSTLLLLKHRLKANHLRSAIQVVKHYSQLPLVECYPGQLNQVFMNLLANAIDALEEKDRESSKEGTEADFNQITIETRSSEDQRNAVIQIKDNGVGMNETVKQKVFNSCFTTKAVGKGTGLGLAIARQIVVEKHGGSLSVNSESGQGAEFVIRLPIQSDQLLVCLT